MRRALCTAQPLPPAQVDRAVHKADTVTPPCAPSSQSTRPGLDEPCTRPSTSLRLARSSHGLGLPGAAELVRRLPRAAELARRLPPRPSAAPAAELLRRVPQRPSSHDGSPAAELVRHPTGRRDPTPGGAGRSQDPAGSDHQDERRLATARTGPPGHLPSLGTSRLDWPWQRDLPREQPHRPTAGIRLFQREVDLRPFVGAKPARRLYSNPDGNSGPMNIDTPGNKGPTNGCERCRYGLSSRA